MLLHQLRRVLNATAVTIPITDKKCGAVIPCGRVATVEDYFGPCVFLASDDSAFVTGQILNVDGGWTLQGCTPDMSSYDFRLDRIRDK
jgi:NAD(P)-dependent dehydrogenase (short-subunit alcohol dehydrogenase family)